MIKGGNQLARGRIPELGGFVRARRQDPSAVRTKRRIEDRILMVKRGDQLARGRIPELGTVIRARRQDPCTVRTKRRLVKTILVVKGSDELARARIPELGGFVSALAVRIRAPSGLNAARRLNSTPDGQRRR